MTLILAAVCGRYAFHASDRLTTTNVSRRFPSGEFDPHSNKTVIVCGPESWLAIGYTGIAFLDGRPTDQLIAEAVTGISDLSSGGIGSWFPHGLHYREIRDRIERAMAAAYAKLTPKERKMQTTVLAAGVQRKGHGIKHVMFRVIVDDTGHAAFEILPNAFFRREFPGGPYRLPASYVARAGTCFTAIAQSSFSAITDYMQTREATPEGFRDLLMDEVSATGAVSDKVGRDVMGVIIDAAKQKVNVHYRLAEHTKHASILARVHKRLGKDLVKNLHGNTDGVPSPYMLAPNGMRFGPSVGTGGWDCDGFDYNITGLPERERQPGELTGLFFSSQPRKDEYGRYR